MINILLTLVIMVVAYIAAAKYPKLSRMAGGGKPDLPFGLDAHLLALPFGIAGSLVSTIHLSLSFWIFPTALLGFALAYGSAYLGRRLGHGQYFDLGTYIGKIIGAEKIDFLVKPFFGRDPLTVRADGVTPFWRDFFGLTLTGMVIPLGLTILLVLSGMYYWAAAVFIGSALKGFAYWVCRKYHDSMKKLFGKLDIKLDEDQAQTEMAEWVFGILSGTPVIILAEILLLTIFVIGV